MPKLSDITRKENCFTTVDGHVLKTIQDFADCLSSCTEENYNRYINSGDNDLARWIINVQLRPRFGKALLAAKSLDEARAAVADLMKKIDYRSNTIPEDKAFHTVDGYSLKSIHELYYYLNNCDDANFNYHCNAQKNDFANWVRDVLDFPVLSKKIRSQATREGILTVLKEFLLIRLTSNVNNPDPEYERYLNDPNLAKDNPSVPATPSVQTAPSVPPQASSSSDAASGDVPKDMKAEDKIELKPLDIEHHEEEEEKVPEANISKDSFRQFTDEELEKFTSFVKQEKSVDADVKTEYLKSILEELKNMIKELRRVEKDPFIAELSLRTIGAKIDYYAQSKNQDDYNHIIRLMKDVQQELEECANHKMYNLAEEIMKDLKLQGITLKKS